MSTVPNKMTCPECGVEMNHHSEKIVYGNGADNSGRIDPALGGILQEFHTCPACGCNANRSAIAQEQLAK
jgi:hypothetical protein